MKDYQKWISKLVLRFQFHIAFQLFFLKNNEFKRIYSINSMNLFYNYILKTHNYIFVNSIL